MVFSSGTNRWVLRPTKYFYNKPSLVGFQNRFPSSKNTFRSPHCTIRLTTQVRTSFQQFTLQPLTLHIQESNPFSSSYTSRFFCHLLFYKKVVNTSIAKMNIMENTLSLSPTDNHSSTEERKQSPPAFLDLADSVIYFSMFFYLFPQLIWTALGSEVGE